MGRLTFSFIDKSDEAGSVSFPIPNLGLTNVEAYSEGVGHAAYNDLFDAVAALTLLNPTGHTLTAETAEIAPVRPSDPNAERETALLVKFADTTGHKSRITIPGLDRAITTQDGTDEVPLAGIAEVEALVTAIETWVVDPITGNAVTVYSIRQVGRNN
jgi:hypothetical protein